MSENIISIVLDFSKWEYNTYRWTLPNTSIIKGVKRLWINNKELLPSAFLVENGFLELIDKSHNITASDRITIDIILTKKASLSSFAQNAILALIAILPALLTFFATTSYTQIHKEKDYKKDAFGPPLVAYNNYPIVWSPNEKTLKLDHEKFMINVDKFIREDNYHAGSDLIYLGQSNNILLNDNESKSYKELLRKYQINQFEDLEEYKNGLFKVPKTIIETIGQMFPDVKLELVLHDARDPIHSVRAIANNMTDRKLGSPASQLAPELIKHYSSTSLDIKPLISYQLKFKNRIFKSTSIPLFDNKFGLFGFICINFDITDITINPNKQYIAQIVSKLARIEMGDLGEELKRN
ncbi:MAG: PAS domain-containing protein [Saprospiraceae bacterium]|nr:PAS domain-containing protein [Candidatus Defluviibacterium haderslevense]